MPESDAAKAFRLFIALPIPESVKAEIARAQDELRQGVPAQCASWTRREQFHLTLKFLGNVEVTRLPELIDAFKSGCLNSAALTLRAERIGCFPDLRYPRVVWVWVHDDAEKLLALQKSIARAVGRFSDSKPERTFTGHVTIARIKGIKKPQAEVLAELANRMSGRYFGAWTADQIKIMRSELSSSGAVHTVLASLPLGAG